MFMRYPFLPKVLRWLLSYTNFIPVIYPLKHDVMRICYHLNLRATRSFQILTNLDPRKPTPTTKYGHIFRNPSDNTPAKPSLHPTN